MKLSVRLIALLAMCLSVMTLSVTWRDVRAEEVVLRNNLLRQAQLLTERLQDAAEPLLEGRTPDPLSEFLERFARREHLPGVVIQDAQGALLAASSLVAPALGIHPNLLPRCRTPLEGCSALLTVDHLDAFAYSAPLRRNQPTAEVVTTIQDAQAIAASRARLWNAALLQVVPQLLLIAVVTVSVVRTTVLGPIAKTARWMKDLRHGRAAPSSDPTGSGILDSIASEAASLAASLASARASAEAEASLREAGDSLWTAERLRVGIRNRLQGNRLFVVSNREPYEHVRQGRAVEVRVPASGLVTALEPVLRACDGTWIAHGSGDADSEAVDERSRLRVPPEHPRYTLRRVWLTAEEEDGYYYGFANEGLWPLCHIAHTRPIFRAGDWDHYQQVNRRFANAVLDEMQGATDPLLLVQDYHLACLPALVKAGRPDARIAVFWHIPWPNSETFGICPWRESLLDGLLGADIVSFHTQAHCRNFLDTVDRYLQSRIQWERFAVHRGNHETSVRPHPISVAPPDMALTVQDVRTADLNRAAIRDALGVTGGFLGVGVDRVDYTKGILERFRGIECFLERNSEYQKRFVFVQVGAPSRTRIPRYHDLLSEVEREADRINRRFETNGWRPIRLQKKHHSHEEIERMYRAADVCLVTSLHDGMNLVAKEFVAARDDEDGVLVLSQYAGASGELIDALLVNPYDVEQLAAAIKRGLEMPECDRRSRMRRMRRTVRDYNVYRWAADLVSDLAEIRPFVHDSARAN